MTLKTKSNAMAAAKYKIKPPRPAKEVTNVSIVKVPYRNEDQLNSLIRRAAI